MLAGKLGLAAWRRGDDDGVGSDRGLCDELYRVLALVETDLPIFFRRLADLPAEPGAELSDDALLAPLAAAYYAPEAPAGEPRARTLAWLRRYVARVREDGTRDGERRARMNAVNPVYLLRNYVAQEAIDAVEGGDAGSGARAARGPATPLRRADGARTVRRQTARLGPPSPGLLDALLQLLSPRRDPHPTLSRGREGLQRGRRRQSAASVNAWRVTAPDTVSSPTVT